MIALDLTTRAANHSCNQTAMAALLTRLGSKVRNSTQAWRERLMHGERPLSKPPDQMCIGDARDI